MNGNGVIHAPAAQVLELLLEETAARHRHLCPRQILGVRLGLRGLRELGLVSPNYAPRFDNGRKRLWTFVEMDGCGMDGVAVATGCDVGRRTLRVLDFGKVATTLVDRQTGQAVRVAPHPDVRQGVQYYAPDARSRWHAYLEAYQVMPDEELLTVQSVALIRPVEAIISRPGARVICQQCGEEVMNEREVVQNGRILCRACAGESYYTPSIPEAR
jgi:formylmethanofuran dehydrogenase subunit E